jgi:hypothetical protein
MTLTKLTKLLCKVIVVMDENRLQKIGISGAKMLSKRFRHHQTWSVKRSVRATIAFCGVDFAKFIEKVLKNRLELVGFGLILGGFKVSKYAETAILGLK